jgi:glutamyl-tRNA synthetase
MCNFLALLGWSPGGDREIMTRDEMIELFSPDGLQKKAAVFDPAKLEWMNGQHLSMLPLAEVERYVTPAIVAAGLATPAELAARQEWYLRLLDLLRVRARTIGDIIRQAAPYLLPTVTYDPDAVAKQWKDRGATLTILTAAFEALQSVEQWSADRLETALRQVAESRGLAAGKLFQPLRVALTGLSVSPGIFDVLLLLGRETALSRIETAMKMNQ